jgi:hypothetical protein
MNTHYVRKRRQLLKALFTIVGLGSLTSVIIGQRLSPHPSWNCGMPDGQVDTRLVPCTDGYVHFRHRLASSL